MFRLLLHTCIVLRWLLRLLLHTRHASRGRSPKLSLTFALYLSQKGYMMMTLRFLPLSVDVSFVATYMHRSAFVASFHVTRIHWYASYLKWTTLSGKT